MPSQGALEAALELYEHSLELKQASNARSRDLVSLELEYTRDVVHRIRHDRSVGDGCRDLSISKHDLETVMRWKLARGKWRPRLQDLVSSNGEDDVTEATKIDPFRIPDRNAGPGGSPRDAAADDDYVKHALNRFCTLRGVGPATASAILALYDPVNEPFMSDEAMTFVGSRTDADDDEAASIKLAYTVKAWQDYRMKMRRRREDEGWSDIGELERALWSWAIQRKLGGKPAAGEKEMVVRPKGKRKAADKAEDGPIEAEKEQTKKAKPS